MKNISYRIYVFFLLLFCFSLSSIILFTQDSEIHRHIGKEIPNIEITNFTLYLSDKETTKSISWGLKALRFEEHEEIYEFFINQINNTMNEYMYAPFVHSKHKIYTFSQGVDYLRLDGLNFWSKWGKYDYNKRVFSGNGDFILHNNTTKAVGQNIYYDMLKNTLKADNIKLDMVMKDKNV